MWWIIPSVRGFNPFFYILGVFSFHVENIALINFSHKAIIFAYQLIVASFFPISFWHLILLFALLLSVRVSFIILGRSKVTATVDTVDHSH